MSSLLLIDDDPLVRRSVARGLAERGHEVHTLENGEEALTVLQQQSVEVLICDLFMPHRDGIETIRSVRRAHPDLPIVAISGGSPVWPDVLKVAQHFGAKVALSKPFTLDEAEQAIHRATGGDAADPDANA